MKTAGCPLELHQRIFLSSWREPVRHRPASIDVTDHERKVRRERDGCSDLRVCRSGAGDDETDGDQCTPEQDLHD